jgi:hypothetical protein
VPLPNFWDESFSHNPAKLKKLDNDGYN